MVTVEDLAELIERIVDEKISKASSKGGSVIATVNSKDLDGTTWVTLEGGVEKTPITTVLADVDPGDKVAVRIENGRSYIDANASSPAASGRTVGVVKETAEVAQETADEASNLASSALESASIAKDAANSAVADAAIASDAATAASTAAGNAQTAANAATFALSDVEKVVGTLEWIAEHGEYQLTTDTAVVAGKVYYTRSGASPNYTYTVVAEPKDADIATYYELHMDESVQNFIASHLWLDQYGLNLSVDGANGYRIHQGTVDGTKAMGTHILDATGTDVASFGKDGFQVGVTGKSHLVGDYHSLQLIDKNSATYFHVSDLRDNTGYATVTESFESNGYSDYVILTAQASSLVLVTAGGVDVTSRCQRETVVVDGVLTTRVRLSPGDIPEAGELIVVQYKTSEAMRAFTFGVRRGGVGGYSATIGEWNTASGIASFAEGYGNTASEHYSHAEGRQTTASGRYSHAEGNQTVASGWYSHAEGYLTSAAYSSHAEGARSEASGHGAHAEGSSTVASGDDSHAQNIGTVAASGGQTALGKYNVEDANDEYAFIIGNGTSDSARSNALTVDWDGDIEAAGGATLNDDVTIRGANNHNVILRDEYADSSYNGVPSSGANTARIVSMHDSNDLDTARVTLRQYANGNKQAMLESRGANSAGTTVWNTISAGVDKEGVRYYGVSEPAKFCEALHVGDFVTASGSSISCASSTYVNIANFTLAAGTWIVMASVEMAASTTGRRVAVIGTGSADDSNLGVSFRATENPVSGGPTRVKLMGVIRPTASTTYYFKAWQNSGAAINGTGTVQAVRIK